MDILAEHGFDPEKFYLGKLCIKGHELKDTGKSVRYRNSRKQCVSCAKASQERIRAEVKTEVTETFQNPESDKILAQYGFDSAQFILGRICKKGHEFESTGQGLRYRYTSGRYAGKPKDCAKCIELQRNQWKKDNHERYIENNRRYYHENRDHLLEQSKQYYQEHREERVAYSMEWEKKLKAENPKHYKSIRRKCNQNYRRKNRDSLIERSRQYYREKGYIYCQKRYLENRTAHLAKSKQWRDNNPDKNAAKQRRRRANKLKNHVAPIQSSDLTARIETFLGKCAYCQKAKFRDWDHFIPVSKGGPESLGNLIPACQKCNVSKGANDPECWYRRQPFYSEKQWKKILKILGKNPKNYNQMPLL